MGIKTIGYPLSKVRGAVIGDPRLEGIMFAAGETVPTDGATGFATGCIFQQTDGVAGTALYINEGTTASADFNAVIAGLTATLAELNTMSGILATTAELNRVADRSTRSVAAGGTLSVTEALHDGKTILLDTAAGSVCTLPAPTVGMRVRFLVTVEPTSNFHQIKVAAATDFLAGQVNLLDADANAQTAYQADGTADDNIQLNGTTKGGQVGDWIEIEGITATQWAITGTLICKAGSNVADPFSAAV